MIVAGNALKHLEKNFPLWVSRMATSVADVSFAPTDYRTHWTFLLLVKSCPLVQQELQVAQLDTTTTNNLFASYSMVLKRKLQAGSLL